MAPAENTSTLPLVAAKVTSLAAIACAPVVKSSRLPLDTKVVSVAEMFRAAPILIVAVIADSV